MLFSVYLVVHCIIFISNHIMMFLCVFFLISLLFIGYSNTWCWRKGVE